MPELDRCLVCQNLGHPWADSEQEKESKLAFEVPFMQIVKKLPKTKCPFCALLYKTINSYAGLTSIAGTLSVRRFRDQTMNVAIHPLDKTKYPHKQWVLEFYNAPG
jgi:hypothetical protein